jgi:hypothetical protein
VQQALESLAGGTIVGISDESPEDFVLPLHLELSERVEGVTLLMEAAHEGQLV